MDSAFIHQAANELVQNAGTRNIKQIARSCSLDISETSRIKDMLGLLSLYFDKPLILANDDAGRLVVSIALAQCIVVPAEEATHLVGMVSGQINTSFTTEAISSKIPTHFNFPP